MKKSAGLLLYRFVQHQLQVLLVHPGGPFWKNKDEGAWTIPKGELANDEPALEAAIREFTEETGYRPEGPYRALKEVRQKSGKCIQAFAAKGEIDVSRITSNSFELEWPPRSGRKQQFPEVDKAAWFSLPEACQKINPAQAALLKELEELLPG